MTDNISKLLTQSPITRWFFIIAGTFFTAIAGWGFIMDILNGLNPGNALQSIPSDLKTMCLSLYAFIAAGFEKSVDKIEQTLNKDLDGDGDIGGVTTINSTNPISPTSTISSTINSNQNNNINTVQQDTVVNTPNDTNNIVLRDC